MAQLLDRLANVAERLVVVRFTKPFSAAGFQRLASSLRVETSRLR